MSTFSSVEIQRIEKGVAQQDILTEVHAFLHRIELPPEMLIELLIKLADIENRLAVGTNEKFQLSSLVAAFHIVRGKIEVNDT